MAYIKCNIKRCKLKVKITKAVIPAAGLGTRVLPATKAIPKEMYPIVDKPAIQYIVEEAVDSGITDILIVTSRGKETIENHFDRSPELEFVLEKSKKFDYLEIARKISNLANIYYVKQPEPKGLGDAILCAKGFIGKEPFAVLYGDDMIYSKNKPVCKQLIEAYEEYGLGVVGAKEMPRDQIGKFGSLKVKNIKENMFLCTDMIEKPSPDKVMSLYSILGRCVLPSSIFDILENTPLGVGGELQLTDAMKVLAQNDGMIAVDFIGKRYDMGSKLGILMASVEMGLLHEEVAEEFKSYLKQLLLP